MVIVAHFGSDVQRYVQDFPKLVFSKPDNCPNCSALHRLIGHGSYVRHPCQHDRYFTIRVKRFLCTLCRHTVSLLPSFCLPYRHYLVHVIQMVLSLRIQRNLSWNAIRKRFEPYETPSVSTCREWMEAFVRASGSYLHQLLRQLGSWQLAPGKLELAVEEISRFPSPPRQLMAGAPHLVAWLRDNRLVLPAASAGWLSTLWQWGHGCKIGRLV